jgi:cytochrome c2
MVEEKNLPPAADALTWLPHTVNASAAGQVWMTGARMGPLNDELIHIGYYRPELFLVLLNRDTSGTQSTIPGDKIPPTGAVVLSLTRDLEFAPLNGAVNPADGQLYVTGFQIWGTTAKQISGLARLRYTGVPCTLPREVVPMDKGILLHFHHQLDPKKALDVANYSLERWNYQRTKNYGSPHFKLDGTPGQEILTPSSAYLSRDGKSVFVGVPDMKPVMQMRFGWSLATSNGTPFDQNAYFTVHELPRFETSAKVFDGITVDLSPRMAQTAAPTPVTAKEGERLAGLLGCTACHSSDGSTLGKVGPSWKGLFGSEVVFTDGTKAIAKEAYLRESIQEPTAKILRGFDKSDAGMPSYKGVITDSQVEALILYIRTLK